jgi:hypothetical protein
VEVKDLSGLGPHDAARITTGETPPTTVAILRRQLSTSAVPPQKAQAGPGCQAGSVARCSRDRPREWDDFEGHCRLRPK